MSKTIYIWKQTKLLSDDHYNQIDKRYFLNKQIKKIFISFKFIFNAVNAR